MNNKGSAYIEKKIYKRKADIKKKIHKGKL